MKQKLKRIINLGRWKKFLIFLPIYIIIVLGLSYLKDFQGILNRFLFSVIIAIIIAFFAFVLKNKT